MIASVTQEVFDLFAHPFLPPPTQLFNGDQILVGFDALVHAVLPEEEVCTLVLPFSLCLVLTP
jgi:hypothetical protein